MSEDGVSPELALRGVVTYLLGIGLLALLMGLAAIVADVVQDGPSGVGAELLLTGLFLAGLAAGLHRARPGARLVFLVGAPALSLAATGAVVRGAIWPEPRPAPDPAATAAVASTSAAPLTSAALRATWKQRASQHMAEAEARRPRWPRQLLGLGLLWLHVVAGLKVLRRPEVAALFALARPASWDDLLRELLEQARGIVLLVVFVVFTAGAAWTRLELLGRPPTATETVLTLLGALASGLVAAVGLGVGASLLWGRTDAQAQGPPDEPPPGPMAGDGRGSVAPP